MNTSSTCQMSPSWPCRRRSARAYAGPNLRHQDRIASYDTTMPRSARRSSTSRKLRVKRWYSQTAWLMISGGKRCRRYSDPIGRLSPTAVNCIIKYCCSPIKMSPFAPNRNVPSGSGWWSAPSPSRLMMATPRDPSRVREAKPYGPALDCSLAVAKTALCSTRRRGSRAYGKRGHLYWATEGDISIELRHGRIIILLKPNDNVPMSAQ